MRSRRSSGGLIGLCAMMASAASGCDVPAASEDDPLLQSAARRSALEGAAGGAASEPSRPPAEHVLSAAVLREVELWPRAWMRCGLDTQTAPTADEIMRNVPVEQRAQAIFEVVSERRLDVAPMKALVGLLGMTGDPRAVEYIAALSGRAAELVDRSLAEQLATDPDQAGIRRYRDDMVGEVRVSAVDACIPIETRAALGFLVRGLEASEPVVRVAAIRALAGRADFEDRERLMLVRAGLPEAMQWTVDDAMAHAR